MNRSALVLLAPATLVFATIFALPVSLLFLISFWSVRSYRLQPDFTFGAWQRFFTEYWDLTLYTLLVGKPPFQADTPFATIQLVLDHSPVRPRLT